MKTLKKILIGIMICLITPVSQIYAAGLLKDPNSNTNTIEIKSHHVSVTINNGFAKTEVDQVFINTGDIDLEAIYSFPIPVNASLSEVSLWIDGNEVIGEVLEKEKAKKTYEEQKAKGNKTAIAEKNKFQTFDIRVFPVIAKDETRVRLVYYQGLEIDLNIGRYVYPLEEGNVDEERISFWETDDRVKQSFKFDAILKSAFPVKDIRMPGFQNQILVTSDSKEKETGVIDEYHISLDVTEGAQLSKDIVLYYRLDETTPARVELIPYRTPEDNNGTFMLVVTPGADLSPISNGSDWTFVLDVSGSMGGQKLSTLVEGVKKSIKKMSADHRFRIVTFNDKAKDITNGYIPATAENIDQVSNMLNTISADNGTALFAGLEKAYQGIDHDRITGIILVTDGVANVGPSTHAELLDLHRKYDCRLFTFVIGNSANKPLLDELAKESGGFAMNISSNDDLIGRILLAKTKIMNESLHDVKIKIQGETIKNLTPSDFGKLYLGEQLVLFGQYSNPGEVKIELTGKINGEQKKWTTRAMLSDQDMDNPEIERLWAMSSIEETMEQIRQKGEKQNLRNKIIDLGTQYSLVTDYTSMVVLSEMEMEESGIQRKNASRVQKERTAQAKRAQKPVKNYQVAPKDPSNQMFGNKSAPSIGTGAIGPLFIGLICLARRFKSKKQ